MAFQCTHTMGGPTLVSAPGPTQRSHAKRGGGGGKGRKGSGKYDAPSTGKRWNVGSGVKNVKYVEYPRTM